MRGRRELQAVGVAIALLVASDLMVSQVATRLTVDARHVEEIPRLLVPLKGEGSPTVLFVGNSITRLGIDVELFERLAPQPAGVRVVAVHPDDTTIADWPFLYDHFVVSQGIAPDVVIVPFATGQLRDDRPLDAGRIGRDYTALGELGQRLGELDGLSERVELVAAYASDTFGNRERLSRRFFDVIPKYRDFAQEVNDVAVDTRDEALDQVEARYDRLVGLSEVVTAAGGRLVVVAMPTPFEYSFDSGFAGAAQESGIEVIDLRDVGLGAEAFRDSLHLSDGGAAVVTAALGEALWGSG